MSSYPISTHTLFFSDDLTSLKIQANGTVVATFPLTNGNWAKVSCDENNYFVEQTTCTVRCYEEVSAMIDIMDPPTFNQYRMGIGIGDMRDMDRMGQPVAVKLSFTYYLKACPLYINADSDYFRLKSPCVEPCVAPRLSCRDVCLTELP